MAHVLIFKKLGLRESAMCLLLAGLATHVLRKEGLWQSKPATSGSKGPPQESDIVFMLQTKAALELPQNHTATRNRKVVAEGSHAKTMTKAGSDDAGRQSRLQLVMLTLASRSESAFVYMVLVIVLLALLAGNAV